jgi:hypothetical protein
MAAVAGRLIYSTFRFLAGFSVAAAYVWEMMVTSPSTRIGLCFKILAIKTLNNY